MSGEMKYKQGKYLQLLDRFSDSGYKICEVTFTKEARAGLSDNSIAAGINKAAKRYNRWHIKATKRGNKIYLINSSLSS